MAFNIDELQDNIVAYLKLCLPNTPMVEDTLEDDYTPPRDANGKLVPYQILRFAPMKASRRGKSMAGVRHDEYYGTVDIMAVASKGRIARRINNRQVDFLIGFKPDGVVSMGLSSEDAAAAQFVVASNEARPTQNVASTRMKFTVNNLDVGAYPTV